MSLDALETQIESIREQAHSVQGSTAQRTREIEADINWSAEGKRQAIDDQRAVAGERLKELRDKELTLIKGHLRSLETKLDAKVGSGATDIIAFRDAQERAERIDDADTAARSIAQALRNNDKTLAHAVFRKSIQHGWTGAVNEFTAENPDSAEAARDISRLEENLRSGGFVRAAHYMLGR
ncbi:hypothetical protein EDF52_10320 [Curtobacterium sp. PhB42]|uniref:hypothetical protein n=1 Tax=unclassified Curtobacterium TaxID=257496 RepID=UPI001063C469|nr:MULTISPECIES: hypothetical protein [unclassified Curtobacterium]TDW50459.1 hypothetical protein EDF52_10320 [Curtobacterium sp. PhB42]TDW55238.1 hypothetical protein EDF47_106290 [Curtobacterium sp. PhB190]